MSNLDNDQCSTVFGQDVYLVVSHSHVSLEKTPPQRTDMLNDESFCKGPNL